MCKRWTIATLGLAAALSVAGCSGGGGAEGGTPETGQVSVVFTDGPTDEYERMLVSMSAMTLIGPGGQVELYAGPEITFDLLQMSEWGDLAFNTEVLAGSYNKIRIHLSSVELVDDDAVNGPPVLLDKLPANGKIDLNPRGPFEVSPDKTTVIKLDIDARRSVQVVETGNAALRLRPVIFVDVYQDDIFLPDRLVRVFGTVEAGSVEGALTADATDDSFRLCDLRFISQADGPSLSDPADCVRVYADGLTGIFDAFGMQTGFSGVAADQPLSAIGFLVATADTGAFIGLNSVTLALGERQPDDAVGWYTVKGVVSTDPVVCDTEDQCFGFDPAGDETVLQTRMQPGTRVFAANGDELSQSDVSMEDSASIDALPVGDELYSALVVLGTDFGGGNVSGVLDSVDEIPGYDRLTVMTESGGMFYVCLDTDTDLMQVLVQDDVVTILDLLDVSALEAGWLVEAFGEEVDPPLGCDIVADQAIVEPPGEP